MDCKEFRELLDRYFDRELSAQATLSAHAHLEGCATCSRAEQQLVLLRRAVKRVVSEREPPFELVRNIRKLTQPAGRWLIPLLPMEPLTRIEGAGKEISFWHKKIAVPTPAFALLLIAVLALGAWVLVTRPASPTAARLNGVNKMVPGSAASAPPSGFDLTQFDRGERPAIYKVRLTNDRTQGR